jgi:hypothetical protein
MAGAIKKDMVKDLFKKNAMACFYPFQSSVNTKIFLTSGQTNDALRILRLLLDKKFFERKNVLNRHIYF